MKFRLLLVFVVLVLPLFAAGQEFVDLRAMAQTSQEPVSSSGPVLIRSEAGATRVVTDETGPWSDLIEYDRKTDYTTITSPAGDNTRVKGKIKKIRLSKEVVVDNYDFKTGKPHRQRFAPGTEVWVDERGEIVCKASCKNPVVAIKPPQSGKTTKVPNTTVYMQRERTRTIVRERDVNHFYKEEVDRPYPVYKLLTLRPPTFSPSGQLGAPTVYNGGGGGLNFSPNRISVTANGGNGYGAAAAAAAAAASTSSTAVTPTSGAGTSGGSSGSSGSSAGGGPSGSNSGSGL